jgi:DNA-directed RNA polymerase I subunit RPA2
LSDGSVKLMFSHEKTLCFAPLALMGRALAPELNDKELCEHLLGKNPSLYARSAVIQQVRQLHEEKIHTSEEALNHLGVAFRNKFRRLPPWLTDLEVAHFLIRYVS